MNMKKTAIFVDIIAAGFVILHSPQERKRTTDGRIVFRDIFHLFIGMEWRKLLLFSGHKTIFWSTSLEILTCRRWSVVHALSNLPACLTYSISEMRATSQTVDLWLQIFKNSLSDSIEQYHLFCIIWFYQFHRSSWLCCSPLGFASLGSPETWRFWKHRLLKRLYVLERKQVLFPLHFCFPIPVTANTRPPEQRVTEFSPSFVPAW